MDAEPTIITAGIFILAYTAAFLFAWRISSGNSRTQAERQRDDALVDTAVREVLRRDADARAARSKLQSRYREVPR